MDLATNTSTTSLIPIATFSPPTQSRTWQSAPHPTLPLLATATSDKSVNIYSLTNFRLLNRITGGHKRSVRSVGWRRPANRSSGGGESVLATGSFDSTVGIWRKEDDLPPLIKESNASDNLDGNDMEFEINDRDEKDDANDDEDAWSFAVLLTGHDSEVKSVAFSPTNPSLLATSSRDKSVWIWEEISGSADDDEYETIAVLTEHSGDVKCVAWSWEDEVLASGSYDDTIRIWREVEEEGDWMCIACIEGHEGTVWSVQWEKIPNEDEASWRVRIPEGFETQQQRAQWRSMTERRGPRLLSASDDLTIRIWRRQHRGADDDDVDDSSNGPRNGIGGGMGRNRLPSIIKPASPTETWIEESILPAAHSRSIYSVAWSERTNLIASCGGDGNIYVYREFAKLSSTTTVLPTSTTTSEHSHPTQVQQQDNHSREDRQLDDDKMVLDRPVPTTNEHANGAVQQPPSISTGATATATATAPKPQIEWRIIHIFESAHGDFEINHICWATRRDRDRDQERDQKSQVTSKDSSAAAAAEEKEKSDNPNEEVLISTGDDGNVMVWSLPGTV